MALEQKQMEKPKNVLPKPGSQRKEIIKRKTPYSSTYLNPNGTFTAEVSSAPVNFKNKSGNWRSINNTLITKSVQGYSYENQDNAFKTKFAQNNADGKLVNIELDANRWLAFSPIDPFAQVDNPTNNSVLYKGIKRDADLEYIVDGNMLKERLIINSPGSNIFRFDISYQGIHLVKEADGMLWAVDANSGQRLMYLQKSYAIDAKGRVDNTISTELVNEAGKETLVLTIDNAWLADAAYPIVVDPAVVITTEITDVGNIHDTYIASGYANTNYTTNNYLHTGYLAVFNTIRSLIKFVYLPTLPPGARITSAQLDMFMYLGSTGGTTVDVYPITSSWSVSQTIWNNQPQTGNAVLTGFSAAPNSHWRMNVGSLVNDWYQGSKANYGFMLRATNEASPKISFYSSNEPTYSKPKLIINYEIDALGAEPFSGFHGNINVHSGNLLLSDTDVTLPGKGIPIAVSRVYNLRSDLITAMGYRWTLNVLMNLKFTNNDMVYFTDSDGSTKTFIKSTDGVTYLAPAGIHDTLFYENNVFVIEEKSGTRYYFTITGKLNKVTDTNNNTTSFSYLADGNIDKITDPSGRQITFAYTSGKLTSITGSNITTVEYAYTGNNLSSMKKKDATGTILTEESYIYDTWNNMTTITDALGNTTNLTYSYTDDLGRRVATIEKKLTMNDASPALVTQYTYQVDATPGAVKPGMITTVTDPKKKVTEYKTNNMGNVLQIIEDKGAKNITIKFTWNEQQNLVEVIDPNGEAEHDTDKYKTVIDPDNTGNIHRIVNPQNNSTIFKYSDISTLKNNTDSINDFSGRPTLYGYDPSTRNLLTSVDPLFSSSVMKYDSWGNVISQTNPIGLGSNLVLNSGFEAWPAGALESWSKTSSGGTVSDETFQKVNGSHSVKLVSLGSLSNQRAELTSDFIKVTEAYKYNISWYVKTENAIANSGIATVDISWYDINHDPMNAYKVPNAAPTIGTTTGFIRKGIRVDAPTGAVYATLALVVTGGPGNNAMTAWYDNVQFEYGSVINQYNLVFNSSFELDMDETNFPDGWTGINLNGTNDILDTQNPHSGNRCLEITGSPANKQFYQKIKLQGAEGIPIHFSGWSRASEISPSGGNYQLKLKFIYPIGSPYNEDNKNESVINFNKSNQNTWDYKVMVVRSLDEFEGLEIYGILENQTGSAWFDDIQVRLDGAPNALMSAYNIAQNGNFENPINLVTGSGGWRKFQSSTPGAYAISVESTLGPFTPISGTYAIKISNVPDWATVASTTTEPIKSGQTYIASALIKTDSVTGSGAVLKFDILDALGNYLNQKLSNVIVGTTGWTRVTVSISEAEAKTINPNAVMLKATVGTLGATAGDMYFDAVRMQEGDIETKYTYDANGNYITAIRNQLGQTLNLVNDGRGNVIQMTDPKNNVYKYSYDKLDNIKSVENPKGLKSIYYYDANSNLIQIDNYSTVYLNKMLVIEYNALQLPKQITDANLRTTYFEYDENAQLKKVNFPNAKAINYAYDAANRLQQVTYDNDTTQWDYVNDANSNVTKVTKNTTQVTDLKYDNLDRLEEITFPSVNAAKNLVDYTYNPVGQILNITHTLPAEAAAKQNQILLYEYDTAGNNVDITGPNRTSAAFMYDEEARLKKSYIRGDMAQGGFMHYNTYRDYDTAGRVTRLRTENKDGVPIVDFSYVYDANSNRTKDIDNLMGKRVEYAYDTINQLLEEQYYNTLAGGTPSRKFTYQYDIFGNRKTKTVQGGATTTYDYNAANEITNINGVPSYTHDYNGNMASTGTYTFTYNAENQLIRIQNSGVEIVSYEYGYNGLRTKKITPAKTEMYYYDGDDLAYIVDVTGGQNKLKYFFTRTTTGKLMHMIDYTAATPKTYWYINDVHGNIIALADETGNKVLNYEYDAWGILTNTPESVTTGNGEFLRNANPFRYAGYQFDPELGLYYLKSRYYTANLGRFLTRDTIISANRYAYCENNPVNFVDPSGYMVDGPEKGYQFMKQIYNQFPGFTRNTQSFITKFGSRIPDFINKIVVGEIKNVSYQYLSSQIRGFLEIARKEGKTFVLVINEGAKLSKPLIRTITRAGGKIITIAASAGEDITMIPLIIDKKTLDKLMKQFLGSQNEIY